MMKSTAAHLSRLVLLLTCLWLAAGPAFGKRPAAPADAAVNGKRAREPAVGGIGWQGNEVLSSSELQAVTFTRPPNWKLWRPAPELSEGTLFGDMARIEALYRQHGYYEAHASYSLVWNDSHTIAAITIRIDEGLPVSIVQLDFDLVSDCAAEGNCRDTAPAPAGESLLTPEQKKTLFEDLPLRKGEPFQNRSYADARQLLLDRLAEMGHPLARIEGGATVDVELRRAIVSWRIDPGPVVYFGDVSVAGLYLIAERTARREVTIRPGQRYSNSALARTRTGLQRQGLYNWVGIRARRDSAPGEDYGADPESEAGQLRWPVEIRLSERSPYRLDTGVGYGSDESFRATVGWRNGNFLGDARKLWLSALYSGILSQGEIEFTQPYFFDPKMSLIFKASLRHETEPAFTANRFLPRIGVSRPLGGPWRGRVNYEFSYQNVVKASSAADVILDEPEGVSKVAGLEFALRRQTLDDLLNPTEGTWLDLSITPAVVELGSDFDYVTFLAEVRGFFPAWWSSVVAARFRIGAIQPFRSTTPDQVPLVSRFFSGGSNSFRGFDYHQLPPYGAERDSVGGTSMIEASLEWRFPIWRKVGGVVFLDAAELDLEPFRYRLDQLYWAIGPGLRYDTIVGPIRFDFGVLLNPPETASTRYRWFISVGHSF